MRWRGVEHMPGLYELCARRSEPGTAPLRRRLIAGLGGAVLEIGAGIGLNFEHYHPGARVTAFDLDPANARHAARRIRPNIRLLAADGLRLPFADRSFDQLVATLVLCSVESQALALAEFRRVLRPGGRLHLLEHTLTDLAPLDWLLHAAERPWGWLTGGCHPNRATHRELERCGWRLLTHQPLARGLVRLIVAEPRGAGEDR